MNRVVVLFMSAFLLAGGALAQQSTPPEKVPFFALTPDEPMGMMGNNNMMFQRERLPEGEISFFSAEMASGGEVVTAAPYSATAITETTQVLGDGNRIVNKTSSFVARDSQGRTRRETSLHRIGTLQMDSPKMVFISDPTTHTQYIMHPGNEATKIIRHESWDKSPTIITLDGQNEGLARRKMATGGLDSQNKTVAIQKMTMGVEKSEEAKQVKHEDLGTQTIEGVSAEGKRETVTIPAGEIGNERPLEIVSETWYSPELKTMVVRKHSDPRIGETVFRLTEIKRNEPDAALFQPPPGTKIRTEPTIEIRQREMAPSKE